MLPLYAPNRSSPRTSCGFSADIRAVALWRSGGRPFVVHIAFPLAIVLFAVVMVKVAGGSTRGKADLRLRGDHSAYVGDVQQAQFGLVALRRR